MTVTHSLLPSAEHWKLLRIGRGSSFPFRSNAVSARTITPMTIRLALGLAVVAALGCHPLQANGQRKLAEAKACAAAPYRREFLRVEGGRRLYVEPHTMVRSGDETLLAGSPTYLFRPNAADLEAADSLMGAVIGADGQARGVRAPIDAHRMRLVRAAPRPGRGWLVAFAEVAEWKRDFGDERITRLWSGEYDGRNWSRLDSLPMARGWTPLLLDPSPLVVQGDSVLWAIAASATSLPDGVVVYARVAGRWTATPLETRGFTSVSAARDDRSGFLVSVTQYAPTTPVTGFAVELYQGSTLRRRASLAGVDPYLREQSLVARGSSSALVWMRRLSVQGRPLQPVMALVNPLASGRAGQIIMLDSSAFDFAADLLPNGRVIAATHHIAQGDEQRPALRVVSGDRRAATVLRDEPSPFTGGYALSVTGFDVLIAGAYKGETEREPVITTQLLRTHVTCDDAGR